MLSALPVALRSDGKMDLLQLHYSVVMLAQEWDLVAVRVPKVAAMRVLRSHPRMMYSLAPGMEIGLALCASLMMVMVMILHAASVWPSLRMPDVRSEDSRLDCTASPHPRIDVAFQ